jgi:hypothetical protein
VERGSKNRCPPALNARKLGALVVLSDEFQSDRVGTSR